MQIKGVLHGLKHSYNDPLHYSVKFQEEELPLNEWLGYTLSVQYEGKIECIHCGRKSNKSFNGGYCYPCFKKLPENDLCIVKPHECHFDQGTCRDPEWGEAHCMIPHYVYLAISSDIKVGLTRKNNQLKRWGDQGAVMAVPIAELPTRKMAGELEVALSEHVRDKTNWRKMLQGDVPDLDLLALRAEILEYVPEEFQGFILREEEMVEFTYPQLEAIDKIKSYNLDKQPLFEDRLIGIKGQYLIFQHGVINMRKYAGYHISIEVFRDAQSA
ncbi:DUF2797 domain-containing protein [Bacillus horti]|uniref:DUF2797 domain-containing protein n=1 Tax=Caldalkalibacillus horti TaxID=77523 RepID=A0ABT9VU03_9BACI|nr:DUF2797 domain-containing protein [Bacillus horti]MDQ0164463.1 hypothetical protein [Bacillus horti]